MDFEWLRNLLGFNGQNFKQTAPPFWATQQRRKGRARIPFKSLRVREIGKQNMTVEEFFDKDERNERFKKLREQKTPDVSKFSTVRGNKSVWCVVFGGR